MCGGASAPTPPPAVPEAPVAPDTTATGASVSDRDRRRRAAASGQNGGTILTSPRGVANGAATTSNTLLGQ